MMEVNKWMYELNTKSFNKNKSCKKHANGSENPVFREMQIKSILWFSLTSVRMAIKKRTNSEGWW